nr:hypothetical protein CFP56_45128 [Quercus suber]
MAISQIRCPSWSVANAQQVKQRQQNKQELVETEHLELPTTSRLPSDEPPKKMSKKSGKLRSAGMVEKELQHALSTLVRSAKNKSKNESQDEMKKTAFCFHNIRQKNRLWGFLEDYTLTYNLFVYLDGGGVVGIFVIL